MTRKLASIQRISSVAPVENSDNLDVVEVMGWSVVTKRDQFKVDDPCVFLEIDSLLPERPEFAFMQSKKYRVKTIRLRGQLSQGLVFPCDILPPNIDELHEGMDVTEILGITKWEPAEAKGGGAPRARAAGDFPVQYIRKTDEPRIQSNKRLLQELLGVPCYVATKMDGQSLTFAHYLNIDEDEYRAVQEVCSRNLKIKDDEGNRHWAMARKLGIFDKLELGYGIQGEFCGPGVNGNKLKLSEDHFWAFQVYDIKNRKYLDYADFMEFCAQRDIPTVPILDDNFVINEQTTTQDLLAMAEGLYHTGTEREGIVIRPLVERHSKVLCGRTSFKVISNKFLLKHGE